MTGNRAISDLVGFVLVFGIIVSAASITVVIGQGQLDEIKQNEQLRNAERGMELVGQGFDRLETGQAVTGTTQLDLAGGELDVRSRTDIRIEINESGSPTPEWSRTYSLDALEYRFGDEVVAYEGGGVLRRSARGTPNGVFQATPELRCTDSQAFVSVVTLRGNISVAGGTTTIEGATANRSLSYPTNRTGAVGTSESATNVTVSFPGLTAAGVSWDDTAWRTLAEDGGWEHTTGNEYRCDEGAGEELSAFVRRTVVNVSVTT